MAETIEGVGTLVGVAPTIAPTGIVGSSDNEGYISVLADADNEFLIYDVDAATRLKHYNYTAEPRREELWKTNNGRYFTRISKEQLLTSWINFVITPLRSTEAMAWLLDKAGSTDLVSHLRDDDVWEWAYR